MVENRETEVVKEHVKVNGLSIAAIILGIISLVLWCAWFISVPCAILALIFGIIGIKKPGKGLAITGVVTGSITIAIWVLIFLGAFMFGFMEGISSEDIYNTDYYSYWSYKDKI